MNGDSTRKPEGVILRGGLIETLAEIRPQAAALGILRGRIAAVGTLDEVREVIPDPAEQIDLDGATVLPGFHDAHTRLFSQAALSVRLNLYQTHSLPEILALVEKAVSILGTHEWIIGHGWDKRMWSGNRFPHRADLDLIAPHHRVALFSADPRIAWLNTEALRAAGVRHNTTDPPGGSIERDPITHAATGILKEEAVRMISAILPDPPQELLRECLMDTIAQYHARGITSLQDISPWRGIQLLSDLRQAGHLYIRIWACPDWTAEEDLPPAEFVTGQGDQMLTYGHLALPLDGTLMSRTACRPTPYESDFNNQGLMVWDAPRLRVLAAHAAQQGWSLRLRASAEPAQALAREILEAGSGPLPHLLDHPVLMAPEQLAWAGERQLGVTLNGCAMRREWQVAQMEWPDDQARIFALRHWRNSGLNLQLGSDYPVEMWTVFSLLQQLLARGEGAGAAGWDADKGLTVREALEALTITPARNLGQAGWKGTLETGKLADLVIVSDNPLTLEPDRLDRIRVLATMVSGNWVYADGLQVRLSRAMRRMLERLATTQDISIPED